MALSRVRVHPAPDRELLGGAQPSPRLPRAGGRKGESSTPRSPAPPRSPCPITAAAARFRASRSHSTPAHSRRSTNTVKRQPSSRTQAIAQGHVPTLSGAPAARAAPGHPFRAQSAASSTRDRTKSPLATAAGQASSGRADWPSSGRRRCRHFRHPEAAEEAEGRPSWVREAPRYRERRRPAVEAEEASEPEEAEQPGAGTASAAPSMVCARSPRRPVLHSALSTSSSSSSSGAAGGAVWRPRR
ncbi:coiled-coil domain-containing protein 8 homolog [Eumetopias jubatus]|uniref:coiled-coil domain-containing protein 8 homolog n=1 Tax=Eumetopias jubatus TaxID=34886 RepID=UPI0010165512|nr:coiled-coil domain-containing protein 8 homolog [Eumetopias jubatus]